MDGNFLHACIEAKLGGPRDALPKLLSGHTKLFSTKCVLKELREMGEGFSGTYLAARRFDCVRCGHDSCVSAAECLKSLVDNGNQEHFFLATQDHALQWEVQKLSGVGIIRALPQGLTLEAPSKSQQKKAEMVSKENKLPSKAEGMFLAASVEDSVEKKETSKRKKRGPNPMSCLPKKRKAVVVQDGSSEKKKRNRPRRKKAQQEGGE